MLAFLILAALTPAPEGVSDGPRYAACLQAVARDPQAADASADRWEATGGGPGATHCRALAQIALGNLATGAAELGRLAATVAAPDAVRAGLDEQASKAWLLRGDTSRAIDAASRALALDPGSAAAHVARATATATAGDEAQAVVDLDEALRLDPDRLDALVYRAAACLALGEPRQARADLDHALRAHPDDPDALLERGVLRARTGDAAGARADFARAAAVSPGSPAGRLAARDLARHAAPPAPAPK